MITELGEFGTINAVWTESMDNCMYIVEITHCIDTETKMVYS